MMEGEESGVEGKERRKERKERGATDKRWSSPASCAPYCAICIMLRESCNAQKEQKIRKEQKINPERKSEKGRELHPTETLGIF